MLPSASPIGTRSPATDDGLPLAAVVGDVLGRAGSGLIVIHDAEASQGEPSAGLTGPPASGYEPVM
jgi:hypothetical protein